MTKTEERLADALAARADALDASSVRPLADAELAGANRGPRRSWWLAPVAAAASIAIVAAVVAVVAGKTSSTSTSGSQPRPIHGSILSLSALSSSDVWAVGWQETHPLSAPEALIVHWNGARWQQVKAPAERHGARLQSVAGSSPDDVWAVGSTLSKPLILHWNGRSWRQTRFAGDTRGGQINGVVAVSATDAWAVGTGWVPNNAYALLLHWNGVTWTKVGIPGLGRHRELIPLSVAAISADDIWAVGIEPPSKVALHWDGRTWSMTRVPDLGFAWLEDVAVGPGDAVWAVANNYSPPRRSVLLRWNGTVWQRVPGPHTNSPLYLGVTRPNSVWAVGGEDGSVPPGSALVFHWNGSSWARFRLKLVGALFTVTPISARSAWAAGFRGSGNATTPIVLHWNGSKWKQVYGAKSIRGLWPVLGRTYSGTGSASAHKAGHG